MSKCILMLFFLLSIAPMKVWATLDAQGWTVFTPTPLNSSQAADSDIQPGSRILYISKASSPVRVWDAGTTYVSGNVVLYPVFEASINGDKAMDAFWQSDGSVPAGTAPGAGVSGWTAVSDPGVVYYWNGTQVVDAAGQAYGTDPFNPSGITSFYSYGTTKSSVSAWGFIRQGYADWCLFQRGESWTASVDQFVAFSAREGKSAQEPCLHGAFGSQTLDRPSFIFTPGGLRDQYGNAPSAFISTFFNGSMTHGYIAYCSLSTEPLDPVPEDRGSGFSISGAWDEPVVATGILLEDIKVNGFEGNVIQWLGSAENGQLPFNFEVTLRRCVIINAWARDHHNQGLYIYGLNKLNVEECIFDRNGYKADPPLNDTARDIFSRNFYLNAYNQMGVTIDKTISSNGGSGGPQMRSGGLIQGSLILNEGYWYNGVLEDLRWGQEGVGISGLVRDNVMFKWSAHGTDDDRSHPGWGFHLQTCAYGVEVYGNIITGRHEILNNHGETSLYALKFTGSDTTGRVCHNNTIRNNIAYLAGPLAVENATSLRENTFSENVVVSNTRCIDHPGQSDTSFTANRYYTDSADAFRANGQNLSYADFFLSGVCRDKGASTVEPGSRAAVAEGWPDPDRSVKSYMESLGYTVTTADGTREFMQQAYLQRKGNWRTAFTAEAVVNYVRAGFNLAPLSDYNETLDPKLAERRVIAYPNPARGSMTFYFPGVDDAVTFKLNIYNFNGERIARIEKRINGTQPKIPWICSSIAPGVYVVRVLRNNQDWSTLKIAILKE